MAVYRHARTGSWIIDVGYTDRAGGKQRIRRQFQGTRRDADREERAIRHAVRLGKIEALEAIVAPPAPLPVATFSGWAATWFRDSVCVRCRPSVQREREQVLRVHLVPWFGDRDVRSISTREIDAYIAAKKRADLSPKTINNHLGILGGMLKAAIAAEYATVNPVPLVAKLKFGEQDFDWLRVAESDRFLAAAHDADPLYYPLFLTALKTGLRQGELLGLRWRDVDLDRKEIRVARARVRGHDGPTKSGKNRQVSLPQSVVDELVSMDRRGDHVFLQPDGEHFTGDMIKRPLWRALTQAGLRRIRFHDLRHTYASQLVSGGAPLQVVKELLGHADIKMTLRYAHLAPETKRQYVDALDRPVALRVVKATDAA